MIKINVTGDRGEFAGSITKAAMVKVLKSVPNLICIIFDWIGEFATLDKELQKEFPSNEICFNFNKVSLDENYKDNIISKLNGFGSDIILLEALSLASITEDEMLTKVEVFAKDLQLKSERNVYLFVNKTI